MFNFLKHIEKKIIAKNDFHKQLALWRFEQEKIVFTNGCFDILHAGHLQYLAQARNLGTKLVVGLNADASVKRLKGNHRPINDELTRTMMLASLEVVDAVIVFEEDTPFDLIDFIRPSVLVKGGDYKIEDIVGADIVLANDGEVKTLLFLEGYSTTNIENKIKNTEK